MEQYSRVVVLSGLVCVLVLIALGIGSGGVLAQPGLDGSEHGPGDPITAATNDTAVEIDPAVAAADSEVTVLVRFDGHPTDATSNDTGTSVDAMRGWANTTRQPFERFAAEHDAVEIDRRLWVANGVVATVDAERLPVRQVGAVRNVTAIHAPMTVSTLDAAASDTGGDARPSVAASQPDERDAGLRLESTGDDRSVTPGLDSVRVPGTWDLYETRGEGVRVAVLDTGVDPDHPDIDLAADGWVEFDETGTRVDSVPYDPNGHGTHVSGTVAGGNATGTAIGVAPDVELLHAKTFSDDGSATFSQIAAGVQWAVENDVEVISMSFGSSSTREMAFVDLVHTAEHADVAVVAASGNAGENTSVSPGDVYESLTVGAVDDEGEVASFSGGETVSRDEWSSPPDTWPETYVVPDVVAPGVDVESAVPGGGTRTFDGTSMAVPHASGVVALAVAASDDSLAPAAIRDLLRNTATDLGAPDERQGVGRIDAYSAVGAVGAPGCGRIEYAGTVTLRENLSTTSDCLTIASDDVVIDGHGHSITGSESGTGVLIDGESRENVTIRNVTVSGFEAPIRVADETAVADLRVRDTTVENANGPVVVTDGSDVEMDAVTKSHPAETGLVIERSEDVSLSEVTVRKAGRHGIVLDDVSGATVESTTIDADHGGLRVLQSDTVTVRNGTVVGDNAGVGDSAGVHVRAGDAVELADVAVDGSTPVRIDDGVTDTVASNVSIGAASGISFRSRDTRLRFSQLDVEPPVDTVAVTDALDVEVSDGRTRLTLPYALPAETDASDVEFRYHDGIEWNLTESETDQEAETLTADLRGNGTALGVVPADQEHESGVTLRVFDAVDANDDGRLTLGELRLAVADWGRDGHVADTRVTLGDIRKLVAWWQTQ